MYPQTFQQVYSLKHTGTVCVSQLDITCRFRKSLSLIIKSTINESVSVTDEQMHCCRCRLKCSTDFCVLYALPVGDRCLYLVFGCIELQIVPTQGKGNYYCHAMYYCIQPSAEESPKPKDEVKWCQKICDMWGCHNSSYSES